MAQRRLRGFDEKFRFYQAGSSLSPTPKWPQTPPLAWRERTRGTRAPWVPRRVTSRDPTHAAALRPRASPRVDRGRAFARSRDGEILGVFGDRERESNREKFRELGWWRCAKPTRGVLSTIWFVGVVLVLVVVAVRVIPVLGRVGAWRRSRETTHPERAGEARTPSVGALFAHTAPRPFPQE